MTQNPPIYTLARLMAMEPIFILPRRLVAEQKGIKGSFAVDSMERLKDTLLDDTGTTVYELFFAKDKRGYATITGEFSVNLTLLCQRCLKPFELPVSNQISIGIVKDQVEAEELPPEYDPLVVTDNPVSLLALIEDEVLLNLPMAPAHEVGACPSTNLIEENATKRPNPFSVLNDLHFKK